MSKIILANIFKILYLMRFPGSEDYTFMCI